MSGLRIERTVSLGIILTLTIQSAGALMWGGAADARIKALEQTTRTDPPVAERLARLEEQMTMARQSLTRIERRLERKD